ncbi:MAG: hypothetical protein PHC61_16780 [Chitinivibrionales bacterium]|nr:hypothetical protein [Chitinivibrionales bacterium]
MKIIDISQIKVGAVTEWEYTTENGELLISKDITITEKHLDALRRRHIDKVCIQDKPEDEELKLLLSTEFDKLEELHFEETPKASTTAPQIKKTSAAPLPRALQLPEFRDIKHGQEGLRQLLESKRAADLDSKILQGRMPDKPVGLALKAIASEKKVSERTEEYKSDISGSYERALKEVMGVLNNLANGATIDASPVRAIVDRFIKTFVTDKNILLNISMNKAKGDDYIYHHTLNVCLLSINIASSIG